MEPEDAGTRPDTQLEKPKSWREMELELGREILKPDLEQLAGLTGNPMTDERLLELMDEIGTYMDEDQQHDRQTDKTNS